jgi:hypothetical protein
MKRVAFLIILLSLGACSGPGIATLASSAPSGIDMTCSLATDKGEAVVVSWLGQKAGTIAGFSPQDKWSGPSACSQVTR